MFDDHDGIGWGPSPTCDSKYWRQKAWLAIQKARQAKPPARGRLVKVAMEYEQLALRAEGKTILKP